MEGDASFFNLLDYVYIALVGASSLFGISSGFTKTLLSLCTWIGSGFLAMLALPTAHDFLQPYITSPSIAKMVAVSGSYVVCLVLLTVVARLISDMVKKSMFAGLDRALGLLFGFLRGLCLPILVVAILISFGISQRKYKIVEESQISRLIYSELNGVIPTLLQPSDIDNLKRKSPFASHPQKLKHSLTQSLRELQIKQPLQQQGHQKSRPFQKRAPTNISAM